MQIFKSGKQEPKATRYFTRGMIIILIIAILLTIFIWKFFDYRIEKIRWGIGHQTPYHLTITKKTIE